MEKEAIAGTFSVRSEQFISWDIKKFEEDILNFSISLKGISQNGLISECNDSTNPKGNEVAIFRVSTEDDDSGR